MLPTKSYDAKYVEDLVLEIKREMDAREFNLLISAGDNMSAHNSYFKNCLKSSPLSISFPIADWPYGFDGNY